MSLNSPREEEPMESARKSPKGMEGVRMAPRQSTSMPKHGIIQHAHFKEHIIWAPLAGMNIPKL
jgi:hypothetical protein